MTLQLGLLFFSLVLAEQCDFSMGKALHSNVVSSATLICEVIAFVLCQVMRLPIFFQFRHSPMLVGHIVQRAMIYKIRN